jgi:uncharacterized membrane protein
MYTYQISSYSKDWVPLTAAFMLWFAVIQFLGPREAQRCSERRLFLLLAGSLAATILSRPTYFPLVALISMPLWNGRFALRSLVPNSERKLAVSGAILILLVLCVSGYLEAIEIRARAQALLNRPYEGGADGLLQLEHLRQHPSAIGSVVLQTIRVQGVFYFRSMVGVLGWLDLHLSYWIYGCFACWGILLVSRGAESEWRPPVSAVLLMSILVVVSCLSVLAGYYLFHTRVGARSVVGVQGRYFLPLAPIALWLMCHIWQRWKKSVLVASVCIAVLTVVWDMWDRYYGDGDRVSISEGQPALRITGPLPGSPANRAWSLCIQEVSQVRKAGSQYAPPSVWEVDVSCSSF